jgi:hypothetical protein
LQGQFCAYDPVSRIRVEGFFYANALFAIPLDQHVRFFSGQVIRNFTHNLAVNYTESILRENDYILGRAAMFFSRNEQLGNTVNDDPEKGLQLLMQLQNLMPNVSSISLTDTQGHYLRAPAVIAGKESETFDARTRPWFVAQAESSTFSRYTRPYEDYFTHHPTVTLYKPVISPEGRLKGTLAFHLDLASMGYTLRQMVSPVQGEFFVVERDGKVILHPDTGALFKPYISVSTLCLVASHRWKVPKITPIQTTKKRQ